MGALHEGHLSLVREAARRTDEVVVTIFVNPTQFGPDEDLEQYPRDLHRDQNLCAAAGATIVFAPPVSEMYPAGEQTRVRVAELSEGMCGRTRPHHFEGVATVVSKLFNAVGPGIYVFGKKDYQQLRIVQRLATDLLFDVEIVGMPIVREPDGLAMSSRNAYLSPEERSRALCLSRGLRVAKVRFDKGERRPAELVAAVRDELHASLVELDYVELRDASTLEEVCTEEDRGPPWVLGVAGFVGTTRLIDNVVLGDCEPIDDWMSATSGGGPS